MTVEFREQWKKFNEEWRREAWHPPSCLVAAFLVAVALITLIDHPEISGKGTILMVFVCGIPIAVAAHRPLWSRAWFLTAVAVLVVLHVMALAFIPWPAFDWDGEGVAFGILIDFLVVYGVLRFLARQFRKNANASGSGRPEGSNDAR